MMPVPSIDMAIEQTLRDQFWHPLCHRSELPQAGDFVKLDWLGQEVVVFNDHGDLIAFDNLCPHRGTRFFTEKDGNGVISCPYHGWSYQAGSLHIPCRDRYAPADLAHARLNIHQLDWCADFLFAAPSPRMSLQQQLGATYDRLAALSFNIGGRSDFDAYGFHCDWRVALENALEPLHVPFVHADSLAQLDLADGLNTFTDWTSTWQTEVRHPGRRRKLESINRLFAIEDQYPGYESIYLFPFSMVSSTYGYSYSLQNFFPSDQPQLTHFSSRLLHGAAKNPAAAGALQGFFASSAQMNRKIFDEDHQICRRIAPQAAGDARFGILSVDEQKVAHFRRCVASATG